MTSFRLPFPLVLRATATTAAAMVAAPLATAQAWNVIGNEPGNQRATIAYDANRGVTVAIGGLDSSFLAVGTTREWDGAQWTVVSTNGPSFGSSAAAAYDSTAQRCVLFGGYAPTNQQGWTWEWDGTNWSQASASGPAPRVGHGMVYDHSRQRCVLFGGQAPAGGPPTFDDTWEWDGSVWSQVATGGPGRIDFGMAFDDTRNRTVLFGGFEPYPVSMMRGETWLWDGTSWTQAAAPGPSARCCTAMAHDSARGVTVLFGGWDGSTRYRDTWEWNGSIWRPHIAPGPSPSDAHTMAYDSQRDRMVMTAHRNRRGTWEYGPDAAIAAFGQGCPSSRIVPRPCFYRNENGGTLVGTLNANEYAFGFVNLGPQYLLSDVEVFTGSTTGVPETVTVRPYMLGATNALASATMTVGPTPGFYRATFANPVRLPPNSAMMFGIDLSAQTVFAPEMTSGIVTPIFTRPATGGAWTPGPALSIGWRVLCPENARPAIGSIGSPRIGSVYQVTLADSPPASGAFLASGLSHLSWNSIQLPAPIPNAPGCELFVAAETALFLVTDANGAAALPLGIPLSTSHVGLRLYHQWLVLDSVNALGAVVSDAAAVVVGQ